MDTYKYRFFTEEEYLPLAQSRSRGLHQTGCFSITPAGCIAAQDEFESKTFCEHQLDFFLVIYLQFHELLPNIGRFTHREMHQEAGKKELPKIPLNMQLPPGVNPFLARKNSTKTREANRFYQFSGGGRQA